MLTQARLKELLSYNRETGEFVWRVTKANKTAGSIAGCEGVLGYREMRVDGRLYLAHRLAWLYVTGEWPTQTIDHRDCHRRNNAFANLREATYRQNNCNRGARSDSRSGVKGVVWHKRNKQRGAYIGNGKKQHYLGSFDLIEDAAAEYQAAAARLFGEFAHAAAA